ncbi:MULTISPECIES: GntR family transcriptional regulator [Brevibacterium]|uniref:GntR family transcriptional regulator n=1 Tax=Brevibacterium gallinarum TaxID=2762220 RepID=A0ABR8WUB9_9MICO|nr:GntR family transcriptional regulator [Brevibacterium gallinarum]MBD8020488.1 GntR family transcriptional regulator [Brevibacterium gallinarum]
MPEASSLAEQAYVRLRDALVMLDIAPGEPIREADLAAEIGIGRTPLREALKRLESEHLVVSYPRRGTFATQVEIADLVDISELRTILEPVAARRAAACQDPQLRSQLEALAAEAAAIDTTGAIDTDAANESDAAIDARTLLEFDTRVHRAIYAAAGNPHLSETLIRLDSLATRIWCILALRLRGVPQHVGEHVELLAAILDGDGERAADLAAEHVSHFETMVRTALGTGGL